MSAYSYNSIERLVAKAWLLGRHGFRRCGQGARARVETAAFLFVLGASMNVSGATGENETPRQFYNEGTQKFRESKLREAEAALHTAVSSQNEKVQIVALYNLGHVRYEEGERELKEGKDGKATAAAANQACEDGAGALQSADLALAQWDVQRIVAAYMQGRGARKELKAASEAVKRALESHGAVLTKWQRASGDFKSAYELNPSDSDAQANASVVDRKIARLVDTQRLMMKSSQCTKTTRDGLKQKMAELKKRLPEELKKQCENGEEEDDEDQDKPPKEPQAGQQEAKRKEGEEKRLTPEEAARLLEMLRLDTNRKLPLGMNDTGMPKDRKRRDW